MNRYYIYVGSRHLRIYKEGNKGLPMEFEIEGRKVHEIYNTILFDLDSVNIKVSPLDKSYVFNRYSCFEYVSDICGIETGIVEKGWIFFEYIFEELLKDFNCEVIFWISPSFREEVCRRNGVSGEKLFNGLVEIINETLRRRYPEKKVNIRYCKTFYYEMVISSLMDLYTLDQKDGIIYIDDNVVTMSKHFTNYSQSLYGLWSSYKFTDEYRKLEEDFERYIDSENIKISGEYRRTLLEYLLYLSENNKNDEKIVLHIRDEEYILDNKMIVEFQNRIEQIIEKQMFEEISKFKYDDKIQLLLNFNKYKNKERIINGLNKMGINNTDDSFNNESFILSIMKYTDCLSLYNAPLYKKRSKILAERFGMSQEEYEDEFAVFDGMMNRVTKVLKKDELLKIYKALGIKANINKTRFYF